MGPKSVCHLLEEDPSLAEAVPANQLERATQECIASVEHIGRGYWSGRRDDLADEGIGLLVLDGLLIRRVGISGGFGSELLGEGDLLRPWQGEDAAPMPDFTTGWRILRPARVAVIDHRVARRLARYPELTGRLVGRALKRARSLAVNMAIVHQTRVDVRVHMLLWHIAQRWGRVRPEGVIVPFRLTHAVLSDLVAARRPTVSTALSELSAQGRVRVVADGWLLNGAPPGELLALQEVSVGDPSVGGEPAAAAG